VATASAPWPELPSLAHAVAVGELDGEEAIAAIVDAIVTRELAQGSRTPGGPPTDVAALRRSADNTVRGDRVLMAMLRPLAPSAPPEPKPVASSRRDAQAPSRREPAKREPAKREPAKREPAKRESVRVRRDPGVGDLEVPSERDLADAFPPDDFAAKQRMRRVVGMGAIALGGVVGVGLWWVFLRDTPCDSLARQVCLEIPGGCNIGEIGRHLADKGLDVARCEEVRAAGNAAVQGVDGGKRGKTYERAIIEALGFDPRTGRVPDVAAAAEKKAPEPLVIASGVANPTSFAVDDAYAYFTTAQGVVGRVRNVGSTIEPLAQATLPSDIVPTADFVYWRANGPDGSGALWVDRKRGEYEPQILAVGTSKVAAAHCLQGECAFVDALDGAITVVAQDDTPPRKLTSPQIPAPHELRIAEGEIVWAVPGAPAAIASVPTAGGPVRLLAGNEAQPRHLRLDETHVYWIGDAGLRRVPRAGGDVQTVVARPVVAFALDGERVVVSDAAGTIAAVASTGGEPQMLASGQTGAGWVAVDAAAIYWTAGESIVRLPK
jgi:hypothetical protein